MLPVLSYFLYIALFAGSAVGLVIWQRKRRKTRKPFGDEFRLVRGPGESLLKKYHKAEEDDLPWFILASVVPPSVGMTVLELMKWIPDTLKVAVLGLAVLSFVGTFWLSIRWYSRRIQRSSNYYLGYFGERIVAENLEPLKTEGWRILHDVPAENNGTKFNLDHVAVGPQGVFAIETKTRRKGNARPGFDDHEVHFDGRDLVWPWAEDNHGLEQAERNAIWLAKLIKDETGERVHVTPILTLPGWFVKNKPARETRLAKVTNPKGLPKFLPAGPAVLDAKTISAIAAKLEARCRDVEY